MTNVIKGTLAGIFIGLAAIINLNCSNPIIGSLMFGFGLFIICIYQFKLFTGIVGFYPTINSDSQTKIIFILDCILTWIYNYLGTLIVGILYRCTSAYVRISPKVHELVYNKLTSDSASLLILGIFCGMLMFLAVSTYRSEVTSIVSITVLFLCVSIFILSGFEHSIADMAYIVLAGEFNWYSFVNILLPVTLGNTFGGIGLCYMIKKMQKNRE